MRELTVPLHVPPMTDKAIAVVREIEEATLAINPDGTLPIQHALHAGMYARTVCIPAGLYITGALIKIPTILVIDGEAFVWLGDHGRRIVGRQVLLAAAGRKQAFRAVTDTHITMIFPSQARTVGEAEREFTDEFDRLASRKAGAVNEEAEPCQE